MKQSNPLEKILGLIPLKKKSPEQRARVGLDIGQVGIRVIVLSSERDKPSIMAFSYVPLGSNISESIKKAISSIPFAVPKVNIGLSGPGVIIRYINLPKMNKDELRGALQFEAEKHIPFSVKDVFLDAHILSEAANNQMFVLLAAVKKELVQQSMQLMQTLGLEINIIDISTIALINTFLACQQTGNVKQNEAGKSAGILDIGLKFSSLSIIEGQTPRLSRDISVGTKAFLTGNKDALISNLIDEIHRSFDFYESQSGRSLEAIYLSGEGSKESGLEQTLGQSLSLPIKFWDPITNFNIDPKVNKEQLNSQAHTIALPLGLALR